MRVSVLLLHVRVLRVAGDISDEEDEAPSEEAAAVGERAIVPQIGAELEPGQAAVRFVGARRVRHRGGVFAKSFHIHTRLRLVSNSCLKMFTT